MEKEQLSINLLSNHILEILSKKGPCSKKGLMSYMWRGNLRIYEKVDKALEILIEEKKIVFWNNKYQRITLSSFQ